MDESFSYDVEGAIFIRFAMVGRPVLNGLAAAAAATRIAPCSSPATSFNCSGGRSVSGGRANRPDDAAVDEFLATVIWDIAVEDFVVLHVMFPPRNSVRSAHPNRVDRRDFSTLDQFAARAVGRCPCDFV
ncbi:hypothetical protein [Sinorhizobium medicae]|uniref:hypothetical protein n=1 Tax=Sinorhizobium medicae TaxID=110321 RepID=UPI001FB49146|nr:hypothetical protein [Sinorhizobium medicae]